MSIIIRLQNLPLSAKSGDIRRFFGGLRIPNGGVHILGGERGEAFIAFSSDEDARLAMRKEGCKIKDARIKLYLSSAMEMHHEIEQITKNRDDSFSRFSPVGSRRINRSPVHDDKSIDMDMHYIDDYRISSPKRGRPLNRMERISRRTPPPRGISRSPRRSRSPKMRMRSSRSPRKSRSPRMRSRSPRRWPRSPIFRQSHSPYSLSPHQRSPHPIPFDENHPDFMHSSAPFTYERDNLCVKKIPDSIEYLDGNHGFINDSKMLVHRNKQMSMLEEQVQLERKITEVLNTGYITGLTDQNDAYRNSPKVPESMSDIQNSHVGGEHHYSSLNPVSVSYTQERNSLTMSEVNILNKNVLPYEISYNEQLNSNLSYTTAPSVVNFQNPVHEQEQFHNQPVHPLPETVLPPSVSTYSQPGFVDYRPPQVPVVPISSSTLEMNPHKLDHPLQHHAGFYVTLSGLDPNWNFTDIQLMLRGIFVPEKNVQWEVDDQGFKTGTIFVKLLNEDDFSQLLSNATYVFNNKLITVSECPDRVFQRYFLPEWPPKDGQEIKQASDLYYRLKGLPYSATYDDLVNFFIGFDIADLYIEYKFGKASGLCWVSFRSLKDYHEALRLEGKPLGHRIVHFTPTTKNEMLRKKRKNGDLLIQSSVLLPTSVPSGSAEGISTPQSRRPLCAMLTGLHPQITLPQIRNFFKDSGLTPDAIHVTLSDKGRPSGRAFVEFTSVQDFDAALKCHGNSIEDNIICVKQILYDEMSKILSTKRAMHDYGKSVPTVNVPEKVPYLWQPPDENHNKFLQPDNILGISSDSHLRGSTFPEYSTNRMDIQVFEYGNQSVKPVNVFPNDLQPLNAFRNEMPLEEKMHPITFSNVNPYFDNEQFQNVLPNQEWEQNMMASQHPSNKKRKLKKNRRECFLKAISNVSNPNLVKIEVEPKVSTVKHEKVDGAIDKVTKDDKKKVNTISPVKKYNASSTSKLSKVDKNGHFSVATKTARLSPERSSKGKKCSGVLSDEKHTKELKNGKSSNESRDKKPERRSENYKKAENPRIQHSSYSRSPTRHGDHSTAIDKHVFGNRLDELRDTIVQISDVHPGIGSWEIKEFLSGFDIYSDQIIRRYGDDGEPTGDVRVTFKTLQGAVRAVKILNRRRLCGIRVKMFVIP